MATMKEIIETRYLSFNYKEKEILKDVSVKIPENKFTVILGRNGSGKSTLLRLVSGLLPYHSGSVFIDGNNLHELSMKQRAAWVGFLPQKHKAVFPFSVREVVLTGRAARIGIKPVAIDYLVADKAMEMAGITHLKNKVYTELSGGEQQLVMIARTLAQQPRILLLDEPISSLDFNNQIMILRLLRKLVAHGMSIAAVIHNPNLAFLFGDYFVFIHKKKAFESDSENAWKHELVNEIFYEKIHRIDYRGKCIFIPQL